MGMLTALSYLLLFQLCGNRIVTFLLRREAGAVRLLMGSVLGLVMTEIFPATAAMLTGFNITAHIIALALAIAAALPCIVLSRRKGKERSHKGEITTEKRGFDKKQLAGLLGMGAVWLFFCFLVLRGFRYQDGGIYSGQATYGDMSMHLGFITSIASQGSFPPEYSILPGTMLSYPFLSDSLSSSLYLLGANLRMAYCIPMFIAAAQVMGGFYIFALGWLKKPAKAVTAWVMFFFNGGFGFIYFMRPGGLGDIMNGFYQTPTNDIQHGIRWVNVLVDMMLPQRGTLFGWAILFPGLYILYRGVFQREQKYFIYAGVLFGALPLVHTHSLLFAGIASLVWMIASLPKRRSVLWLRAEKLMILTWTGLFSVLLHFAFKNNMKNSRVWLYLGCGIVLLLLCLTVFKLIRYIYRGGLKPLFFRWGLLLLTTAGLALPQLFFWTFSQVVGGDFLQGCINWANSFEPYITFNIKNIGFPALLLPFAMWKSKRMDFVKFLPAAVCWAIAECIRFQPNEYDNNKLLYPAYALICCLCGGFMIDAIGCIKRRPMRITAALTAAALCMTSAVLTMAREVNSSYELFAESRLELCRFVETLEPDAVVLTSTRHNNEIAALTGRNIVCGSSAYLYYHGLDYEEAERAVEYMYRYPVENRELFEKYSVDYVMISDHERESCGADEKIFASRYECVYNKDGVLLYRVGRLKA